MPNRGPFPTQDAQRNTYYNQVIAYIQIAANQTRLGIINAVKDALVVLLNSWNDVYPKTQNPDTATKSLRQQKDELILDIEESLRDMYNDIPESALTTGDRNTFNLKERDTVLSARPRITDTAFVKVQGISGAEMQFTLRTNEDSTRASRHADSNGADIVYTIASTPPAGPDECTKNFFTSKAKGSFNVGVDNAGKKVFGFVRWKNTTDNSKSGPWSQMFSAVISD